MEGYGPVSLAYKTGDRAEREDQHPRLSSDLYTCACTHIFIQIKKNAFKRIGIKNTMIEISVIQKKISFVNLQML